MTAYRDQLAVRPPATLALKSFEFRRQREATWVELEELIDRVDKGGLRTLSAEERWSASSDALIT